MGQTVTPQQPHVVHFSDVKEATETESGRFEFFKQMLTVGLGGIAGLAAIFTETDKIPEELLLRVMLGSFGICALVVVIVSSDGISTYANHLRAVRNRADNTDPQQAQELKTKADELEQGILTHARWALAASWVGALALLAFAGIKLFQPHAIPAEAAMKKARQIIAEQPGDPKPNSLDHFESSGSQYIISYMTDPGHVKYTVRINRDNHDIMEVVPTQ